jgi:hypothetical protein
MTRFAESLDSSPSEILRNARPPHAEDAASGNPKAVAMNAQSTLEEAIYRTIVIRRYMTVPCTVPGRTVPGSCCCMLHPLPAIPNSMKVQNTEYPYSTVVDYGRYLKYPLPLRVYIN